MKHVSSHGHLMNRHGRRFAGKHMLLVLRLPADIDALVSHFCNLVRSASGTDLPALCDNTVHSNGLECKVWFGPCGAPNHKKALRQNRGRGEMVWKSSNHGLVRSLRLRSQTIQTTKKHLADFQPSGPWSWFKSII